MTLDLWTGIAIGIMVANVTLFAFLLLDGKRNKHHRNLDEANQLLRDRNNIGIRQCEALEIIAYLLNFGGGNSGITEHEEEEPTP